MNTGVNITGAYHSGFGRLANETLYSLYEKAAKGAIKDAGLAPQAIDGVFVGNFSGGTLNNQENIAPYGVNVIADLRFKPHYRTETACTSGSSAVQMAAMAIMSGQMDRALVVGIEKMTDVSTADVTKTLALATYWPEEGDKGVNAPCMFADLAKGWMGKYKYSEAQLRKWLAQISAKAYNNGSHNPLAQIQKPRSAEDILTLPDEKNPIIHAPLRLHDCSLISDGAAAIILERGDLKANGAVALRSFYNASDYLDCFGKHKSDHYLEGAAFAIKKVLQDANLNITDIDLAEVHDCFTITELLIYSALGLAAPGKEFEAIPDVMAGGRLPINLSGGLKAKGHPIGATGVAMHAHIYKQLMGEAWGLQQKNAAMGITVNIGGAGTSNCVSILERV